MKFLKGLALTLLGFLLFVSLNLFALVTELNMTALSPSFVSKEAARLNLTSVVSDVVQIQGGDASSAQMKQTIVDTLQKLEPEIDKQLTALIYSVYDYMLGKKPNPELARDLRSTFLSKAFVDKAVSEVDLAPFMSTLVSPAPPGSENSIQATLASTAVKMAPELKSQIGAAADPVLAYLTNETQSIDLATVMRQSLMSDAFMSEVIDEGDLSEPLSQLLSGTLSQQVPADASFLTNYINANMPKTIDAIQPELKAQLKPAVGLIADYLVGKTSSFSVDVQLGPVAEALKKNIKTAILASPPAEFAGLSQDVISAQFDTYWAGLISAMPASVPINEQLIGADSQAQVAGMLTGFQTQLTDMKTQLNSGLGEAETQMKMVRPYIGYYQMGYWVLIVFILLLIGCIYLIYRSLKAASSMVGKYFLTIGIEGIVIFLAAKYLGGSYLPSLQGVPAALQDWLPQLLDDIMKPELIIGIVFAVIGLALVIFVMLYKRAKKSSAAAPPQPTQPASPAA
jgi:hypothetical protein